MSNRTNRSCKRQDWLTAIRRKSVANILGKHSFVCSAHFRQQDLFWHWDTLRYRVRPRPLPSIFPWNHPDLFKGGPFDNRSAAWEAYINNQPTVTSDEIDLQFKPRKFWLSSSSNKHWDDHETVYPLVPPVDSWIMQPKVELMTLTARQLIRHGVVKSKEASKIKNIPRSHQSVPDHFRAKDVTIPQRNEKGEDTKVQRKAIIDITNVHDPFFGNIPMYKRQEIMDKYGVVLSYDPLNFKQLDEADEKIVDVDTNSQKAPSKRVSVVPQDCVKVEMDPREKSCPVSHKRKRGSVEPIFSDNSKIAALEDPSSSTNGVPSS